MTKSVSRRLCIAPMMDRTDRHFRFFIRSIAPNAFLYTEMVPVGALLRGDAQRHLRYDVSEHPVALQLGGNDPQELAQAARLGAEAGYDEINLNVGCPSDRVQHACWGAALMLDAQRVCDCVAAMQSAVDVPVTVKTRLGVDDHDDYEFLSNFVDALQRTGCRTVILHARKAWLSGLSPKENREIPPLDYDRVARIKADFPQLEVIINGGIVDADGALGHLDYLDGVMIGRAAWRQPMLIAQLDARIFAKPAKQPIDALEAALPYIEKEIAAGQSLRFVTKHLFGLFAGQRNGRLWRTRLAALHDDASGLAALQRFVEQARRSGIVEPAQLAA